MANMPPEVVNAPEPRSVRYGLFTAAAGPLPLSEKALSGGVRYRPVSCGRARLYPVECANNVTPPTKQFDPQAGFVDAEPFLAYAGLQCGSVGATAASMKADVLRTLANGEQTVAEQGLATILAAGATPRTAPDPTDIRSVIGALEQWLYGDGAKYGNVGVLHMPPRYAALAGSYGVLFQQGLLWRTHMGTVVSIGGGYPDGGSIFITGHTTVWRAEDVTVPDPEQTFDWRTNQYYVLAEREYAVAYDCHAAVAQYTPVGES